MTNSAQPRWDCAWIIGASTGIGQALAHRLASQSRTVAISARTTERMNAIAQEHANMVAHTLDVTDQGQVSRTAKQLELDHGMPDLVIISSGVWHPIKPDAFDPEIFRNAVDVNFMGVINVLAAVVPKMIEHGGGHIAIIASVSGYRGLPNAAAYSPMKAALINLAESIYPQLKRKGVDLTIVNPSFVDTPMTSVNKFPMPFLMTPEEAAERISKGLDRRDYEIAFPTRFVLILKLLRVLPNRIFFWIINKFVLK